MNKMNEEVELELYIYFISGKGFSAIQNIIPNMEPINPSIIIIKKGSTDSNSRRYLSMVSIIDKKKYSSRIKPKDKINSL